MDHQAFRMLQILLEHQNLCTSIMVVAVGWNKLICNISKKGVICFGHGRRLISRGYERLRLDPSLVNFVSWWRSDWAPHQYQGFRPFILKIGSWMEPHQRLKEKIRTNRKERVADYRFSFERTISDFKGWFHDSLTLWKG